MSHELRTPLTAIRMAVLLLLEENYGKLTPGQQRLLGAARDDGDRLYGIIEDLLNLSRIESGRARFQPRPIDLSAFIPQALGAIRRDFTAKNITVREHWADLAATVVADPEGIGLALTNLLSNAMKFTPAGGTIWIDAEAEGDFIGISVADTGPGIPAELACRVFEKFFRIPRKTGGNPTGGRIGSGHRQGSRRIPRRPYRVPPPRRRRQRVPVHAASDGSSLCRYSSGGRW